MLVSVSKIHQHFAKILCNASWVCQDVSSLISQSCSVNKTWRICCRWAAAPLTCTHPPVRLTVCLSATGPSQGSATTGQRWGGRKTAVLLLMGFHPFSQMFLLFLCSGSIQNGELPTSHIPAGCLRSMRMCGGCLVDGTPNTNTTTSACPRWETPPVPSLPDRCWHPALFLVLVQVRLVSQEVLFTHNSNISEDSMLSHMLVDWGQWIDHDLVLTPQSPSTVTFKTGADCTHTCSRNTPCFPIQVRFTPLCHGTLVCCGRLCGKLFNFPSFSMSALRSSHWVGRNRKNKKFFLFKTLW